MRQHVILSICHHQIDRIDSILLVSIDGIDWMMTAIALGNGRIDSHSSLPLDRI